MKMNKTNLKKSTILACVFCLILTAFLLMSGCADEERDNNADEHRIMNIDIGEEGMIRNGTEYETYQVEEGKRVIISVHISRKSGSLDLDIYPTNCEGAAKYTGRNLNTTSFDVILDEPSEYKLRFTAKDFVGDYGTSRKIEDKTEE